MNRLAMPQNIGLSIGPMGAEAAAVGFFSGMNGCVSGKVSLIPEGASTQRAAVAAAGAAVTTTVAEGVATQQHLGKWLRWASFGTPRCVFPTN